MHNHPTHLPTPTAASTVPARALLAAALLLVPGVFCARAEVQPSTQAAASWSQASLLATAQGAVCDGTSHPLGGRYPSLAAAQADYPTAASLSDELDGVAIARAVAVAAGRGGGEVQVLGSCRASRPIPVPGNIWLHGLGRGVSTIIKLGDAGPLIQLGDAATPFTLYARISDMTLMRDTGVAQSWLNSALIHAQGLEWGRIERIAMPNYGEGIRVSGGNQITIEDVTGSSSLAQGGRYGFRVDHGTGAMRGKLPTSVTIRKPNLNALRMAGGCYGLWVTSAESLTLDDAYIGQSSVANVLLELDGSGPLLDNRISGGYLDAAGVASLYLTGTGVPAADSCNGTPRPGTNGPEPLLNTLVTGTTVKGQGGDGPDGILIAGGTAGGAFPKPVTGTGLVNVEVSAFRRHGYDLQGGVGTRIVGGSAKGNNYLGDRDGRGIYIGPFSVGTLVSGVQSGGDAFGLLSAATHQMFGIEVAAGAAQWSLQGNDLRNNVAGPWRLLSQDGTAFGNAMGATALPAIPPPGGPRSAATAAGRLR